MQSVLVAYGTWLGCTREVAEAVGAALRDGQTEVAVRSARDVTDLGAYDAVVLGTPVRAGRLHPQVVRFVRRHRQALSRMPVAYFVVCLNMSEDTPKNREETRAYLRPLFRYAEITPVEVGLFAGTVRTEGQEFDRQFALFRQMLRSMAKRSGDRRDWKAIRAWAEALRSKVQSDQVPQSPGHVS